MPNLRSTGPIRAVFFDAVGTLLCPAVPVAATYREVAGRHGANLGESTIRDRLRQAFARQDLLDRQAGWRTNEARKAERWRSIVQEVLPETADSGACFRELWDWYSKPSAWSIAPHCGEVLTELAHRGLVVGMASNFDARLSAIVRGLAELAPVVDRCIISSLIGWRKPAIRFFEPVIAAAGCAPSEVLFVGDDPHNDVEAARQAGMQALLYDARS